MTAVPRVVVTGVGLVTPLGVGVNATWPRLLAGNCGVVSLEGEEEFRRLPCQLAARVPRATTIKVMSMLLKDFFVNLIT